MALEEAALNFELHVCSDGAELLQCAARIESGDAPWPDLLLLDLNLPKHSGEEILERFRENDQYCSIPIIVITSSDSSQERAKATAMGASYFRKPSDLTEFLKLGEMIQDVLTRNGRPASTRASI
jgi:DNA-binding response OmpR family regulator